jgi:hypothetical protein
MEKKSEKKSTGRGGARPGSFIPKNERWGHTVPYTFRLPASLISAVDQAAAARSLDSRTAAVIQALEAWLASNPKK